ncbi:MAG: hypothetical protein GX640_11135 [Fibrobacter sp.]|nr:hypothetical protein [Fibrobacter sp.]
MNTNDRCFRYSENSYEISIIGIVESIIEIFKCIVYGNQIYVCKDGIYRPESGEIRKFVTDKLNEYGIRTNIEKRVLSYLNEINARILSSNNFDEYPFNSYNHLIPFKNGVVSIDYQTSRIDLLAHDANYRFTYRLNVDYDPSADSSFITGVLKDWMGDLWWVLVQIIAQCFFQSQGRVFKKAYLIIGRKDAGKSTYLDLLSSVFSDDLIAKVDFQRLTSNNFALAQLEGKFINLADDQPAFQMKETGTFKKLTGSATQNIEVKYEMPRVAAVNPVYIFAANDFPKLPKGEDLNPLLDRFEIILFDRKFELNPSFSDKLTDPENLSALLNLALQEMIKINHNSLKLKSIVREVTNYELWVLHGNLLYRNFVLEHFVKDDGAYLTKDTWYNVYLMHCVDVDLKPYDKTVFFRKLSELGITDTRITRDGERVRVIKGWDLKLEVAKMVNQDNGN